VRAHARANGAAVSCAVLYADVSADDGPDVEPHFVAVASAYAHAIAGAHGRAKRSLGGSDLNAVVASERAAEPRSIV
jgi:hypothetical protein